MRRVMTVVALCAAAGWIVGAQQTAVPSPSTAKAATSGRAQAQAVPAQEKPVSFSLSVDAIMRGPRLIGNAPTAVRFAADSSKVYFSWQKPDEDRPNTWVVNRDGSDLRQLTPEEAGRISAAPTGRLDRARKRLLATEGGNIVVYDLTTHARRLLVKTAVTESSPRWARNDTAVTFLRDGNLYLMALDPSVSPAEVQLTEVTAGGSGAAASAGPGQRGAAGEAAATEAQRLLRDQEPKLIDFIKQQAERRQRGGVGGGQRGGRGGAGAVPAEPIARFTTGARQTVADMLLSTDEHYVFIGVTERPEVAARSQGVPSYVTESSYPEMINGRSNVGDSQARRLLAILDLKANTTTWADASAFAGREKGAQAGDKPGARLVDWSLPECSDDGTQCVAAVRSADNHDRWFVKIDAATGRATAIDTLHDDAWIREEAVSVGLGAGAAGGFGGGASLAWLPDNKRALYLAERDGWMHVWSLDVSATPPVARPLTSGRWEVSSARLSNDRSALYLTASEVHPGEHHFYTMSVDGGPMTRITTKTGGHEVTVSPDEKSLVDLFSTINRPPEIFVMPFEKGAAPRPVTTTPVAEWLAFTWIEPKVITYKARDGQTVYARLYTPEMVGAKRDPRRPAVIFAHGAGFLQFAHKYWSQNYYREHMFHHLLATRGYVVLAPDYRASSGYGRDWRTGIYEHMGGKDLDDCVDGAKYLSAAERVDPKRIGIYGGSYGGFLTLMALFTTPDVFAAGAALRPVTDWAHYNHSYTAPILGLPQASPEAYRRSSPIYFAEGLKNQLLICHGMVDTNVFFQDSVRLVQRLIELRKETWSVAPYPVEDHAFTTDTSWADEYRRILKLFDTYLKNSR